MEFVLREPNYLQCDNFCEKDCKVVRGSTIKLLKLHYKLKYLMNMNN